MTRVEPDGGGGDAVGINPQLLQSMINTMDSSAGDALNLVNGYTTQLSRVGLDTSRLNRAVQDLTWAQDQVPMLDRRQSLAQTMAQQNPASAPSGPGRTPARWASRPTPRRSRPGSGTPSLSRTATCPSSSSTRKWPPTRATRPIARR